MANYKVKINDNGEVVQRPIKIIDYTKFYEGSIFTNRKGDRFIIEKYQDKFHVYIRFLDEFGYRTVANLDNIVARAVKNPYHLNKYGGYYGVGDYNMKDDPRIYKSWEGILRRCMFDDRESYINSSMNDDWRNLQVFAAWYINYRSQLNPRYYPELEVDKDILQWNLPLKSYSSQTCCLIPKDINSALIGIQNNKSNLPYGVNLTPYGNYSAYGSFRGERVSLGTYKTPEEAFEAFKQFKKENITQLASSYYNDGGITKDIYDRLCNLELLPF